MSRAVPTTTLELPTSTRGNCPLVGLEAARGSWRLGMWGLEGVRSGEGVTRSIGERGAMYMSWSASMSPKAKVEDGAAEGDIGSSSSMLASGTGVDSARRDLSACGR